MNVLFCMNCVFWADKMSLRGIYSACSPMKCLPPSEKKVVLPPPVDHFGHPRKVADPSLSAAELSFGFKIIRRVVRLGLPSEGVKMMKNMPARQPLKTSLQRGFSMIELLVVMAVMGLLVGSSVGVLSSYQGETFTKQAYDMREILASAKSTAMAKNTFVWVGFGSTVSNGQQTAVVSAFASRSGL